MSHPAAHLLPFYVQKTETGFLFVGCLPVPEPCSLPCVCEQSVEVLTLRMATKCANQP